MTETVWFDHDPARPSSVVELPEENAILFTGPALVPDRVRLPPELGGGGTLVTGHGGCPCPRCDRTVRFYTLDHPTVGLVYLCPRDGCLWCAR